MAQRARIIVASLFVALACTVQADPPAQMSEDFAASTGTAGFGGGSQSYTNPGTGGVGGVGDGFLRVENQAVLNFATADFGSLFTGDGVDYVDAGITGMRFWLNDVGADDDFEIHVSVGTRSLNVWTTVQGFSPGEGGWEEFMVDFTNPGDWVQTHNGISDATFDDALRNMSALVFRHDLAPFVRFPDPIAGDLGIDRIQLVPEPATVVLLAMGLFGVVGRRARCGAGDREVR